MENSITTINQLEEFLNDERKSNNKSSWNKLDKSTKIQKLCEYCNAQDCSEEERIQLKELLLSALEKSKLQKIKEVDYDTNNEIIRGIYSLIQINGLYSLKAEKRPSASKSLLLKNNKLNVTKKKKHKIENKE